MIDEAEHEENEAIAGFVADRLATRSGRSMSGIEFVRSLGFEDVAAKIEAGRAPTDPSQRESAL